MEALTTAILNFIELVAAAMTGAFLSSYLSQKGKNRADKEDAAKIADLIENSKRIHQEILEKIKVENGLRASIIEKRMTAHQEAYDFCRKINSLYNLPEQKDEFWNLITEISKWWGYNCLFLDKKPRQAFLAAWVTAKDFEFYLNGSDVMLITKGRRTIWEACQIIEDSVGLPPMNVDEIEKTLTKHGHS